MDSKLLANKFRGRLFDAVLGDGSLAPAFQPIIDLKSGSISSFEVLARWTDHQLGVINPSQFIPMIEQAGLLDQMTNRILYDACSSAVSWGGAFRLAFNASPAQFADPNFPERIGRVAADTAFPVDRLQVEITESAIFDDVELIENNVGLFKKMGIRILLDDFGTGFSSLTRLQAIPFDKIKIDASFIRSLNTKRSRMIVSSVIGLGQSLSMPVVAEGVETENQLDILRQLGCDYGQGYLFSRPVFAEHVPSLLDRFGQNSHEKKPMEMSCSRRLAELNTLYESSALAVCFLDTDARMVSISRKFCDMTGIDNSLSAGRIISEIFPYHQGLINEINDPKSGKWQRYEKNIKVNTSNGECIFILNAVKTEDGDVIGTSIIIPTPPIKPISLRTATGGWNGYEHLCAAEFAR